jgi:hypothetical protein
VALGTELVKGASGLKTSEVRYYRKVEEVGAKGILQVLKEGGDPSARLVYLAREENPERAP